MLEGKYALAVGDRIERRLILNREKDGVIARASMKVDDEFDNRVIILADGHYPDWSNRVAEMEVVAVHPTYYIATVLSIQDGESPEEPEQDPVIMEEAQAIVDEVEDTPKRVHTEPAYRYYVHYNDDDEAHQLWMNIKGHFDTVDEDISYDKFMAILRQIGTESRNRREENAESTIQ